MTTSESLGESLALTFFKQARHLSPKTVGLTTLIRAIATKDVSVNVLELGAQRSLSKFSLFTDGWSSLVFGTSHDSVGSYRSADIADTSCFERIIDPPFNTNERRVPYFPDQVCALQFIAGPELKLFDPFPDLIYLDGPNDQMFTNDVLSYLIPAIEKSNQAVYLLIDDVEVKLARPQKIIQCLIRRGFELRHITHTYTVQNHIEQLEKPDFQLTVDQLLLVWPCEVGGLAKAKRVANQWKKAVTGISTVKLDEKLFVL